MADASSYLRTWVVSCGLLVAACGDDNSSGNQPTADAAVVDAGEVHAHDSTSGDAGEGGVHDITSGDAGQAGAHDASSGDASAPDPTCSASISLQDFKLVPENPSVMAGNVVLCAHNDGKAPHDLGLRGADMQTLQKTATLGPGESGRITLTLAAGSFAIYCSQAGHESLGMKGTLAVH